MTSFVHAFRHMTLFQAANTCKSAHAVCMLQDACDKGLDADEFVEDMKKRGIRVAGIGHRIKSKASSSRWCPCRLKQQFSAARAVGPLCNGRPVPERGRTGSASSCGRE